MSLLGGRCLWAVLGALILGTANDIRAQAPLIGADIFLTFDATTSQGWTFEIAALEIRNANGAVDSINGFLPYLNTFNFGAFGGIFSDGIYEFEPFIYSPVGSVGGAWVITNQAGVALNGIFSGWYQGFRVARIDRTPIELKRVTLSPLSTGSLTNMMVGFRLTTYVDLAAYRVIPPSAISGLAYNLGTVPIVRSLGTAATPIAINGQSFSVTAPIIAATNDIGTTVTSPAIDPIIGAFVIISGVFTGADLVALSDFQSSYATAVVAGNGRQSATTIATTAQPYWSLAGAEGTMPSRRLKTSATAASMSISGGPTSPIFDGLTSEWDGVPWSLLIDGSSGVPCLSGVRFIEPSDGLAAHWGTNGSGSATMGVVRAAPGDEIRNIIKIAPTTALGTGPFFGLELGFDQWAQLNAPVGATPFHVTPDTNGNYFFGVPNGAVPPGLVADCLTIVSAATHITPFPVQRVTF